MVFECMQCGKTFIHRDGMKKHVENKHMQLGKRYECPLCLKTFGVQKELQRHRRNHSLKKTFKCPKCQCEPFKRLQHLQDHMKTFHPSTSIKSASNSESLPKNDSRTDLL